MTSGSVNDAVLIARRGEDQLAKLAALLQTCKENGIRISTAESLTGGGIGYVLTELSGSSNMYDRGFGVYNNKAKHEMLGVSLEDLEKYEAVSETVARQMVVGALTNSDSHLAISVTGYASDYGDESRGIPGGTVFIGSAYRKEIGGEITIFEVTEHHFKPERTACRDQTIAEAIEVLGRMIQKLITPNLTATGDLQADGNEKELGCQP